MALDCDGRTVVDDLGQIDWTTYSDGWIVREQLTTRVLHCRTGWAVVLIVMREQRRRAWNPDLRYHLTRWRRLAGAWRLTERFRLRQCVLDALMAESAGGLRQEAEAIAYARDRQAAECARTTRWFAPMDDR